LPTKRIPLAEASGFFLAEGVRADRDLPPCDRSAMDGYAVRSADLPDAPVELKVAGEVPAGSANQPQFGAGECVRIFTGAVVPPDADTVVMQEDTESAGDAAIRIIKAVASGRNIFRRGENARLGSELVPAGVPLDAVRIGLCASAGCAEVMVHRKPLVGILATGDEIRRAGDMVAEHQTRDSNGPMVQALLSANGFDVTPPCFAADQAGALRLALQQALQEHDVVLLSGGVSVGDYDLVPATIKECGGEIVYHGVLIKPGKPQLMAVLPDGKYIFGLPGNPLSVMTGMQEFVLPFLRMLAGCKPEISRITHQMLLAEDARSGGKRQQYLLARYVMSDGQTALAPIASSGSADLAASGTAIGTIIVPAGVTMIPAGTVVDFRPWGYFV
jgi:molybdopterin molybdotransferase